jgi:hypothetical protein
MGSQFSHIRENVALTTEAMTFEKPGGFGVLTMTLRKSGKVLWRDISYPFRWKGRGHFAADGTDFTVNWSYVPVVHALKYFRISAKINNVDTVVWELTGDINGKTRGELTSAGISFFTTTQQQAQAQ